MEIEKKSNEISYEELYKKYQELQIKNNNLQIELNNLKKIVFGTKREYTPTPEELVNGVQGTLFNAQEKEEKIQNEIKEKTEEITVYKKKNARKKRAGIKKNVLKNVTIERKEYILNEGETCPKCEGEVKEINAEVIRQEVTFVPAKFVLTNYVQYTYKCTECGTKESENETATFLKTELPKPLLTHSFASPSLAAEVIYQKYFMGVPLYRQERIWDDRGLVLPRNMMANWNIKLTEYYFSGLYSLMDNKLKSESEVLHSDETTIQCNKEAGRKAENKSYMWVLCSGELEEQKGIIFKYEKSRSEETAKEFLKGYSGILVTDGYASYNNIPNIVHAECWAHCRRYFYESIPLDANKEMDTNSDSYIGLEYCNKLFEIEREIAKLTVPEKENERQVKSKPIVDDFFEWVKLILSEKLIVNSKLKKALIYASNQRKELSEFLNDGRIPISNNLLERSIRPFAIHRKNWLFADSEDGAKANAVIYSLIESAKINNLNIWKYLEHLLEELPQLDNLNDTSTLEKYLPWSKELPDEILNYQYTDEELAANAVAV